MDIVKRFFAACALLVLAALFASCSSDAEPTGGAEPTERTEPAVEAAAPESEVPEGGAPAAEVAGGTGSDEFVAVVSEQNVAEARSSFDAAKQRWQAEGPASYKMLVGYRGVYDVEVLVVDGVATTSTVVQGEGLGGEWGPLPMTVDEAFTDAERFMTPFEADPSKVPGPSECGEHFLIQFDPELGFPAGYHSLGPCDDGIGLSIEIFAT